jgi:uncharacterized protein
MSTSRLPIREGLLSSPLTDLKSVSLMGTRCQDCRETTLGTHAVCPNCSSAKVQALPLSHRGTLFTYTIVRHKPPGNYLGPEPFQPFVLGLVELPEGLRVMAPIAGAPEAVTIGMPLHFQAFVRPDAKTNAQPIAEVVSFAFHV